jgi:PII-like signaling protein
MKLEGEGKLLRIFCGEADKIGHQRLTESILFKAKTEGLAGVTIIRGIAGFGANSRIHTEKILRLSEDLPIIIEIIDTCEKIDEFLKEINTMVESAGCGVLITEERANIIKYTSGK